MDNIDKLLRNFCYCFIIFCFPNLIMFLIAPLIVSVNYSDIKNFIFLTAINLIIFLIILILGFFNNKKKINKYFCFFAMSIFINILFRFLNADVMSSDYVNFLQKWVSAYRNMSLKSCFASNISNYSPPYNYFLILFSRIPFRDLYLIKTLSFIFEIMSAFVLTKLIAYINKANFNIMIFASILFIPIFLINSSVWAQCDSIYTFFGLMAIYSAIKGKSKGSFLFFGISLAFKLQAIILFPVALVLLLTKNEDGNRFLKWKDMWWAAIGYASLSGIAMIFGGSFEWAFLTYFKQSVTYNELSSLCPNLAYLFNMFNEVPIIKVVIMISLIVLTIGVMCYILIIFIKKKILSNLQVINLSFLISFYIVLLMSKMIDRYFYLSNLFGIVLLFTWKNKMYKKAIFITLLSSFAAHASSTAYIYTFGDTNFLAYCLYFSISISAIYNVIIGVLIFFVRKKIEIVNK